MNNQKVRAAMSVAGGISLLVFPLMLMVAFALHLESLAEFFEFRLYYDPSTGADFLMRMLRNPAQGQRYYILPHTVAYLSMPLLIATALSLGAILFKKRPWFALVGTTMACVGAVFMSGVFAIWLSFAAIGNVPAEQLEGTMPVLEALTEMQGVLMYTTLLSVFSIVGLMVLAVGLFFSEIVPKWAAIMIFIGNLAILVFRDLDNWMFVGALLVLIGMIPISLKLFGGNQDG